MRTNTFAFVVGAAEYEHLAPLPSAVADAERIAALLRSTDRGCLPTENVRVRRSPGSDALRADFAEVCREASNCKSGLVIAYFAGHGLLYRRNSLAIAARDTDPSNLTLTSLPLDTIASILGEIAPCRSIVILDLCHAGAHGGAVVELALNEMWKRDEALSEGHFILGACAADATSKENVGGGRFTTTLLEVVDRLGRQAPFMQAIAIEAVASGMLENAESIGQRPTWSGVSVARSLDFVRNPYWDPQAPHTPGAVSVDDVDDAERPAVRVFSRAFQAPMHEVGSGASWVSRASSTLLDVGLAELSASAREVTIARLCELARERVSSFGTADDHRQLLSLFTAGVVAIFSCGGGSRPALLEIAYGITCLSDRVLADVDEAVTGRTWVHNDDGPAAIALAPIRYWNMIGATVLVALAARSLGQTATEGACLERVTHALRAEIDLHRLEWAGQYPDVVAGVSIICHSAPDVAVGTARRLFESYVSRAKVGLFPEPASLSTVELGRNFARRYAGNLTTAPTADVHADEALALLLLLLAGVGESPIAVSAHVARMTAEETIGDYYLYEPQDFAAQFYRGMVRCRIRQWIRRSEESSARMLQDFQSMLSSGRGGNRMSSLEMLGTLAAGRVFRNRAGFQLCPELLASTGGAG